MRSAPNFACPEPAEPVRVSRQLDAIRLLHAISTRFVQEGDAQSLFEQAVDAAISISGADMGNIQILDPVSAQLKVVARHSPGMRLPACCTRIDKTRACCGMAALRAERMCIEDLAASPPMAATVAGKTLLAAGVRAVNTLPLFTRSGQLIGMLSTHSLQPRPRDELTQQLLDMLARQIADIMERSRAIESLRKSSEHYRSLFDNMLDGYAHCRMIYRDDMPSDFEYLTVNRAFEKLTGLRDVVGRRASEVSHDIRRANPELFLIYANVVESGEPARFETYVAASDAWFSIAAYRPAPGEFVAIMDDISERKRAENALHIREERLQLAKRAAGLGVYDLDIADNSMKLDERVRQLWGVAPEETITYESFVAGIHPEDLDEVRAAEKRAFDPAGDGRFFAEYRVIGQCDGQERHIASTGKTYFQAGRPVRLIGMIRDITEKKRLEKEIYDRRNEMEAILKHQVALQTAAAIAHELNQPLVAMSAYSEAALSMLEKGITASAKLTHALEGSVAQAQRAGRTLHDLLDFLQHGDTVVAPMDLNETVRESITLIVGYAYGGCHPGLELEPGLPPVLGNRTQVQKVLLNLLHNGIQAMRNAGMSGAKLAISVQTRSGQDMAQVSIRDRGPGIDAETAARIFEPFFTTKADGIGLGLAISRALIEAQGGKLWVEADSNPGATFKFTLPYAS